MKLYWQHAKIQIRTTLILDSINIQINDGESYGIIGPNASGKTILAKAIAGLLPVRDAEPAEPVRSVFVSFQSGFQLKHGARAYRQQRWNLPDAEFVPTVRELFEKVEKQDKLQRLIGEFGFQNHLSRFVISLSNGEQRKFELIKAMAEDPELLVIDNAFNGLDAPSRVLLHDMLNKMVAQGRQLLLTGLKPDDFPASLKHFIHVEGKSAFNVGRSNIRLEYPAVDEQLCEIPRWENSTYNEIIDLEQLSLVYNNTKILDQINWRVMAGDKWVLAGGNGSGKTSLLNMIFGDNPRAYKCRIRLFGRQKGSGESIWDIKNRVGFVSPEMHQYLPAGQSVNDVLCSGFYTSEGLYSKPTSYQRILSKKWLQLIRLGHLSDLPFNVLASSHQRMVLVLRALIKNPPLLIFDEPFQGLDPENIAVMKNLLNSIAEHTNCTMIFVSHFDDEVPASFNRRLTLNNGKVVSNE